LAKFGWPANWTILLTEKFSPQDLLAMAEAAQLPAALSVRVNLLKTSVADYQRLLTEQEIVFEPLEHLPEGLLLPEFSGSPRNLPGYEAGLFYVQDAASMWVSRLLNPQPNEQVLDLCAAPGSKTTHMAALMQNTGQIVAVDPKQERLNLLSENIQRLGVTNIQIQQADGLMFQANDETLFDKVLVDAPCSGSGTLRRHPEILLQLKKLDVAAYNALQLGLLKKGFACLRSGGVLVYSTCSILAAENNALVQRFLAETPNAQLELEEQRLIQEKTDGFYAARLLKI
jgi:16S rRNA (cytosine967-C5)-methyltransferase